MCDLFPCVYLFNSEPFITIDQMGFVFQKPLVLLSLFEPITTRQALPHQQATKNKKNQRLQYKCEKLLIPHREEVHSVHKGQVDPFSTLQTHPQPTIPCVQGIHTELHLGT